MGYWKYEVHVITNSKLRTALKILRNSLSLKKGEFLGGFLEKFPIYENRKFRAFAVTAPCDPSQSQMFVTVTRNDGTSQDPWNSCKMIDTKNADFRILVRTNFREVCPDFI